MNFIVKNLGESKKDSPLIGKFPSLSAFVDEKKRNLYRTIAIDGAEFGCDKNNSFEVAGPRKKIFFDPKKSKIAIATCGGLCPGLNNVIRAIVMEAYYRYEVKDIIGIRYGYNGFKKDYQFPPIQLTPENVTDIHTQGGTILGSSRGGTEDMEALVDRIEELGINILFTIGGDGTLRGAHDIALIAEKRNLKLSVIGIPKTIDNDISYIQRSFGFETAFSKAVEAISSAHVEACGALNGIGVVKLMGRHSGFIAANATLAMNDVNFLLVPEIPFTLDGENGLLEGLKSRLNKRGHALICIAEGAGQDLIENSSLKIEKDASGNIKLLDIGVFIKNKISDYFKKIDMEVNLKYIDPSYIIRSMPANPNDSILCIMLGQSAVHAAMAGKTDMVVGVWNNIYTHVPIELAVSQRKVINRNSRFWFNVLEATGQPFDMN